MQVNYEESETNERLSNKIKLFCRRVKISNSVLVKACKRKTRKYLDIFFQKYVKAYLLDSVI